MRSRGLQERRIVVLRDPEGESPDGSPGEVAKRAALSHGFEECRTPRPRGVLVSLYARRGHR